MVMPKQLKQNMHLLICPLYFRPEFFSKCRVFPIRHNFFTMYGKLREYIFSGKGELHYIPTLHHFTFQHYHMTKCVDLKFEVNLQWYIAKMFSDNCATVASGKLIRRNFLLHHPSILPFEKKEGWMDDEKNTSPISESIMLRGQVATNVIGTILQKGCGLDSILFLTNSGSKHNTICKKKKKKADVETNGF